ncbi:MAG: hypothetical protein WBQ18_09555 [Solirubrobacteraceae bacterium]
MLWPGTPDGASGAADLYRFGPGLTVSIRGARRARAYFRAEYASAALATSPEVPAVEAIIGSRVRETAGATAGEPELLGAHKLARWRASVPMSPEVDTMRVAVAVRGPLGLALVQSHVIEPLVSLAAVRAGSVLLPGAAIARGDRTLLLLGRSRSGKTSLAARALAAGLRVLGDDQVIINADRECLPFPRRLRLYPDLSQTAPAAFAALRPSVRVRLAALGRVSALTRGFVAPPVSVSASGIGPDTTGPVRLLIGEVVVVHRARVDAITFEPLDAGELAVETDDVLMGQRSEIFGVPGVRAAYDTLLTHERAIISCALAAAPARRVLVPDSWTSDRAVGALAHELELA